jgi:hypothetical protein
MLAGLALVLGDWGFRLEELLVVGALMVYFVVTGRHEPES